MAITSNLDLANYALSLVGEMTITSLGDTTSKAAVLSNTFVEQAILETLAMHEWQEATKRATLTSAGAATYGGINRFTFPTGALRIVEVNASTAGTDTLDYFIEEREVRANASTIYVRYIDDIAITACGPLLQKACALRLALHLTIPLTGSAERLQQMEALFAKCLGEARSLDVASHPLTSLVLSRLGVAPDTISSDLLRRFRTFADDARKEVLRRTYTSEATALTSMDTLAIEAVHALHTSKIAAALSLPSGPAYEERYQLRLREARLRALQTSSLNGRVLAMIGADLITKDISDTTITELVTNLATDARKEVLRTGLFSSALEIVTLSTSTGALGGKAYSFALPTDCLALVEIAADSAGETLIDYEIIDQKIASDTTPVSLRYIKDQSTITDLDVLAQSAIDALHAAKIAHYLSLPSVAQHEDLYQLRLRQARKAALDESDISTQVLALVGEDLLKAELSRHQIRWFRRYADDARKEVLRMHRWNCATARAILTPLTPTTGTTTYSYRYLLPTTCLRVLEINGESYEEGEALFEIESGYLYANSSTAWIRYIDEVAFADLDPLLQQAITLRHAAKIAAVTALSSAPMLEQLAHKRLGEARQANSHVRSADNNIRHRLSARSTILRSRGSLRNPLRLEDY